MPLIKTAALLITHADFATVSAQCAPASSNPADGSKPASSVDAGAQPDGTGSSNGGSEGGSFAWGVLQQLKVELKGCGDVAKLLEGAALLAQLACIPDCSASALQTVMVMLVNRYPKVCIVVGMADYPDWCGGWQQRGLGVLSGCACAICNLCL
jgi:hypothetical protein